MTPYPAAVDTQNIASIQLLKSVGFRQEGHFIENIFFKVKWGNEYQYAMLRAIQLVIDQTSLKIPVQSKAFAKV